MNAFAEAADVESQLRNLADNLPGGLVYQLLATATERKFLYISQGVDEIFGVTAAEALANASSLYTRILPEYLPVMEAAEQASIVGRNPFMVEVAIRGPGDKKRWVRINSAARLRQDGVEVWDGVVLDITEQKEIELAHRAAETRLELATAAARIGIWQWNIITGELTYSALAREIYGFSPNEKISYEALRELTFPDDMAETRAALSRALDPQLRSSEVYQYRIMRGDTHAVRWVLAYGSATFKEYEGRIQAVSYVGTIQDVTDQHVADGALRASEERLRLAIGSGKMAVWELDVATGEFTRSAELNQLYGFPPDALTTAEDFRSRYAPGERERVGLETATAMARGDTAINVEPKFIWPDGTVKWLAIRAQVERDATGEPIRGIGIVMDITERREAEERLKIVARELQHRVKNSLAVVQTVAAQTFRRHRPYDEAMPAFTGRLQALAKATDLLTNTAWEGADLSDIVEQITRPYRDQVEDIFTFTGAPVLLPSSIAVSLAMGLHELCTNALKYGALSIPTGRIALAWTRDENWLHLAWTETGGPTVAASPPHGFGMRLLQRGLLEGPNGSVNIEFEPHGLKCVIRARLNGT